MVQFPYDGKQFIDLELQNHSKWHLAMLNFWHKSPDVRKWRGQPHYLPLSPAVSLNSSRRGAPNSERSESNIGARNSCILTLALSMVLSQPPWARHSGVNHRCLHRASCAHSWAPWTWVAHPKSIEVFKNQVQMVPAGQDEEGSLRPDCTGSWWSLFQPPQFQLCLWLLSVKARPGSLCVVTCKDTQPWSPHLLQGPVGAFLQHEWMGRKENQQILSLAWQVGSWPAEDFWLTVNLFLWQACCKENMFPSLTCTYGSCLLHHVTGRGLWAQGCQKAQPNLESKHTSQNGGMWVHSLMSFSSSNLKWSSNLNCYK